MKILFLTQLFPYPPVCGGTIRGYNILRHLGKSHDVTMVSFVRKQPTPEQMEEVQSICGEVFTVPIHRSAAANLKFAVSSLARRQSFIVSRDWVPEMQEVVDRLLSSKEFDMIYMDHLQMAQYIKDSHTALKVLDEHNVEWRIIERIAKAERTSPKGLFASLEWKNLRDWELRACERFDLVLTVTEHDKETLTSADPRLKNVLCLPIGVDFDEFPAVELKPKAKCVLSIATMSWPPNIDSIQYFAKSIYPTVRERVPESRLLVVGKNPPESVKRLSQADSSIEVTGFIDDMSRVTSNAAVFIVPLRSGSGMRVKILNAMAMGLPIVSTSVGCEGIGAEDGRHLLIADNPADFAEAVVKLLTDFELRKQIGKASRAFVLENYGWDSIFSKLDVALGALAPRAAGPSSKCN